MKMKWPRRLSSGAAWSGQNRSDRQIFWWNTRVELRAMAPTKPTIAKM